MSQPLRLVAGLGNPGAGYADTRHNAGFWFVDAVAAREGQVFRPAARFFGDVCDLALKGDTVRLLKPATWMNRSGQSVLALASYYRVLPEEILVVHDDIDLPPGSARLKRGGGHGGHNGLRDIIATLGSRDFLRLRLGVGHPRGSADVVDYVLHRPPVEERTAIQEAVAQALGVFGQIAAGEAQRAMNVLHARPKPPEEENGSSTAGAESR